MGSLKNVDFKLGKRTCDSQQQQQQHMGIRVIFFPNLNMSLGISFQHQNQPTPNASFSLPFLFSPPSLLFLASPLLSFFMFFFPFFLPWIPMATTVKSRPPPPPPPPPPHALPAVTTRRRGSSSSSPAAAKASVFLSAPRLVYPLYPCFLLLVIPGANNETVLPPSCLMLLFTSSLIHGESAER